MTSAGTMSPGQLLKAACDLVRWADPATAGLWPRAAALLGRQALESGLDRLWTRKAPGLEACSMRAQLLALPAYLASEELAEQASHAWWALTRATHQHAYELPPTAEELSRWLEEVAQVLRAGEDSEKAADSVGTR